MQRSKIENYHHLVWATWGRKPFVEERFERAVFGCIRAQVTKLKCETLSLNGMPDHVHLVVKVHSTVAIARLAQAVKGVSSQMANDDLGFDSAFKWQDCYASFSLTRTHVARAVRYVDRQKIHHARGKLWDEWEETDVEMDLEGLL